MDRIETIDAVYELFGTGFSALKYLKTLPFPTLKIDYEFIAGLPGSEEDESIVAAVIDMAHGLGLDVVAEGVEGDAQAELLRELGCDRAQGFLFDRALPAEAFWREWRGATVRGEARGCTGVDRNPDTPPLSA